MPGEELVLVHLEHKVGDLYTAIVGTTDDSTHWELMVTTALHHNTLEWGIVLAIQDVNGRQEQVRNGLDWLREALTPMLGRALARCEMDQLEVDRG